jgi:glycerol-3-phosphate acyltransferase PlsY
LLFLKFAALILTGYLLGGIPVGLVVGELTRGIDIRQYGSGMVGATNTLRTLGWGPSAVVFLADVSKAAASVLLARLLGAPDWVQVLAGVGAVVGHCWSVYIKFGGGRGVACSLGAMAVLSPIAAGAALVVAVAVMAKTHYVSLGSLVGTGVGLAVAIGLVIAGQASPALALFAIAAAVVVYRHKDNMQRLWAGTERRLGEKAKPVASAANGGGARP